MRRQGTLIVTAALLLLAACSDNGTAPPDPEPSAKDPVTGIFALTTVNLLVLPFNIFNETGFVLDITASTMELQQGGQYVMVLTTRETVAGFPSTYVDSMRGTWVQNVGVVTLTENGTASPATWDGVRLGFQVNSDVGALNMVYRKNP